MPEAMSDAMTILLNRLHLPSVGEGGLFDVGKMDGQLHQEFIQGGDQWRGVGGRS